MVTNPLALTALCSCLAAAAVFDAAWARIPNRLTGGLAAFGLLAGAAGGAAAGLGASALGLVVGAALFLPWRLLGGVGSGDLKLMAAVGAVLGARDTVAAFLAAALIGGVLGIALWVSSGLGLAPARRLLQGIFLTVAWREPRVVLHRSRGSHEPQLPYALPIALGTLLVVAARAAGIALPAPL